MKNSIEVQNLGEVLSALNRVRLGMNDADVLNVLMDEAGKPLRSELRASAPRGPSGNLRKAIQARKAKMKKFLPAVYVLVNRRIAPHLHWVTGGTSQRQPSKKKFMKIPLAGMLAGNFIFRKRAARMKPNAYFAETFSRMHSLIYQAIADALGRLIDKAAR